MGLSVMAWNERIRTGETDIKERLIERSRERKEEETNKEVEGSRYAKQVRDFRKGRHI